MTGEGVMRSVYLPEKLHKRLRMMAHEKGVSISDLIRAAVAGRLPDWQGDDDALLLQDVLIAKGNNGIGKQIAGETLTIPKAVIDDVREKYVDDLKGAIHSLLSWWNSVSPPYLPPATAFDLFGTLGYEGYSYTVDCPDQRSPASLEGRPGTAKADGICVEFRFHRFHGDTLSIVNMDGDYIEGCRVGFDSYEFWMGTALKKAFGMEWSADKA